MELLSSSEIKPFGPVFARALALFSSGSSLLLNWYGDSNRRTAGNQ